MTHLDIISNALQELGVLAAGETASSEDAAFCMNKLNRIYDNWNAESQFIYGTVLFQGTLTPNHSPHTLGAGFTITNTSLTSNVATFTAINNLKVNDSVSVLGCVNAAYNISGQPVLSASSTSFTVAITHADIGSAAEANGRAALASNGVPDFVTTVARPSKIEFANLVLTDQSPNIFTPLKIVDDAWWMSNPTPDLGTKLPYYLWPNYSWPNAQLYLWPVPTTAYDIRLDIWTLFSQMTLSDVFTLPAGYEDAITLSLAESLIGPFKVMDAVGVAQAAQVARMRIKSLNAEAPLMSCDPAVHSVDAVPRSSMANFLSGFIR